jgi:hypothetical protein
MIKQYQIQVEDNITRNLREMLDGHAIEVTAIHEHMQHVCVRMRMRSML